MPFQTPSTFSMPCCRPCSCPVQPPGGILSPPLPEAVRTFQGQMPCFQNTISVICHSADDLGSAGSVSSGGLLGYIFKRITFPTKKAEPAIHKTMTNAGFHFYTHKAPNCYSFTASIIADSVHYANGFSS